MFRSALFIVATASAVMLHQEEAYEPIMYATMDSELATESPAEEREKRLRENRVREERWKEEKIREERIREEKIREERIREPRIRQPRLEGAEERVKEPRLRGDGLKSAKSDSSDDEGLESWGPEEPVELAAY